MKKRILALIMAVVLVVALAACGEKPTTSTPAPTATTAPSPTKEPTKAPVSPVEGGDASIDFEDGNSAFAMITLPTVGSEASAISVEEVGGSKVLFVKNTFGKKEAYVGFDLASLLGDKIADIATIKFDVALDKADTFAAASGEVYTYTGENASKKTTAGKWSVYLEKANPKTITVEIKEAFVAGQDNYMVIGKVDDVAGAQSFYLDNIKFLDKDGKLITADTTVAVAATSPLNAKEEAEFIYGKRASLNLTYQEDWNIGVGIPAEFFANANGPVNVVLDVLVLNPGDWAGFFATDKDWNKPVAEDLVGLTGDNTGYVHFQDDGAIIFDDLGLTKVAFTITKEAAAKYANNGGMFFPGYNVQVLRATVSDTTFQYANNITYQEDWNIGIGIPAEFFAGATAPVTVGLDVLVLNPSDWAGFFATDKDWAKPVAGDILLSGENTGYIHFQDDGAIIFDDLGLTHVDFTITAEAAAKYAANGGMFFPGYNVQIIKSTVSKDIYKCKNNITYQEDWNIGIGIPAEFFANANGPVNVDLDVLVLNPGDWAGFFATDKDWAKPTAEYFVGLTGENTGSIHFQDDGAIIFDDLGLTHVSFTLTKEAAEKYATNGGMFFPGYNVQILGATVSTSRFEYVNNVTYQEDWNIGIGIPAEFFADATKPVTVTLDVLVLNPSDWAGFFATDKDWAKPVAGDLLLTGDNTGYVHFQDDGAIIFDDLGLTQVSFTLTAEAAAKYAANGGMFFPGYNVQIIRSVVTK